MIALQDIIADPPLVHKAGTCVWGLSQDVLEFLDSILTKDSRTLETGAGVSTVLFAARSASHTCITPSSTEVDLLKRHCRTRDIAIDHVDFRVDFSQNVLPHLDRSGLDAVLIDGGHGYPIPAVDWLYTAPMLKIGGRLIIDDIQLWTGWELDRFLSKQPGWAVERRFPRSVVFCKLRETEHQEWNEQPFVVQQSRIPRIAAPVRAAARLLAARRYSDLLVKLGRSLRTAR